MNIRTANKDESHILARMAFDEYIEDACYMIGQNFNFLGILGTLLSDTDKEVLVAEEEGTILGYIYGQYVPGSILDQSQTILMVIGWYVPKNRRGKGIGHALYDALEQTAKAKKKANLIQVGATLTKDCTAQMDKYKRMGFTPFQMMFFKPLIQGD